MKTVIATFLVFIVAVVSLAVGPLLGRRQLKGTCGRGDVDPEHEHTCENCPNRDNPEAVAASVRDCGKA